MIDVLVFATPLALAALGESVSQKCGVINIGLEGTMLVGAYFATITCQSTGYPVLGIAAGALSGLLLTLIFGYFTVALAADQAVVGTAINLLALGVTSTLFRSRYGASGSLLSVPKLPTMGGVDALVVFVFLAVLSITWVLKKTELGLLLRATGEFPKAVESAGFSVNRLKFGALALGGVLGGLGGAHLALGVTGTFAENMTAGRGFLALALVTFGRWTPFWVMMAALFMGYLDSLQYVLQARGLNVPFQLLVAMPYVAALAVLIAVGKGGGAPQSLGVPFRKQ